MTSLSAPTPVAVSTPIVLPLSRAFAWLAGAAFVALGIYYFVGVDQGAFSVFGSDMHVHEFVHDGRHFLGFPCH
jgi:Probable cobalt transporter subunit (CbtB)